MSKIWKRRWRNKYVCMLFRSLKYRCKWPNKQLRAVKLPLSSRNQGCGMESQLNGNLGKLNRSQLRKRKIKEAQVIFTRTKTGVKE